MCGIIAIRDPLGRGAEPDVRAGLRRLHHRGPDAANVWQSPDRGVTLGHARLSIIDLATGDQPIANEDGTLRVVVNGEFYDFEAIRRELEGRGHRFRTKSDSEILLHLYEELGPECVHRLRGEYAFVLWDGRRQRIFAGRDRFGIKPLFHAVHDGRLLFASEAKALHAAGVPAAWDETGFMEAFTFTGTGPRTLFKGIQSVPPGHYITAEGTEVVARRYWDFDFPREEDLPTGRADGEYAEEFRALLEDAVRVRLRADVPVGCYLSGGLDSCSILALMAKHAPQGVRAFSLAFDHEHYDESPIAREMAAHCGASFELIPATQRLMAADLSDAVWHCETMFINGGSSGKFALSRAVREAGYKVVLTGEGSDEITAGYSFFRADLARFGGGGKGLDRLAHLNPTTRGFFDADPNAAGIRPFEERIGYTPTIWEARRGIMQSLGNALSPDYDSDAVFASFMGRVDVDGQMKGRNVVNQSLYLHNKTTLPSYLLVALGDRVEMGHSVEGRLPFLDHKLVEYTRKLPITQKIHDGVEKYVLREAMKPLITETVYKRQKHPFLSPPSLLKPTEPLHELMQDTLRGPLVDRVPYLRRAGIVGLLDGVGMLDDSAKVAMEFPLMQALTACLLAERFGL